MPMVEDSMTSRLDAISCADPESVREGFWVSLLVHGLGLLGLLLLIWLQGRERPPEELHVFELVSVSEPAAVSTPAPQATPEATPLAVPRLNLPPLQPAPEIPRAEPTPVVPPPTPPPATPPPPRETPAPRPVAAPPPQPRPMTIEEFRRQNPQPRTQPAPRPRPAPNAGIDTEAIRRNLRQLGDLRETSAPTATRSAAQQSALDAWAAEIKRRLDAAWIRPGDLGTRTLSVRVSFSVEPDGRLTQVRIVSPSGEPVLDASVQAAFRSASPVRPPPDSQRKSYTVSFDLKPE